MVLNRRGWWAKWEGKKYVRYRKVYVLYVTGVLLFNFFFFEKKLFRKY